MGIDRSTVDTCKGPIVLKVSASRGFLHNAEIHLGYRNYEGQSRESSIYRYRTTCRDVICFEISMK